MNNTTDVELALVNAQTVIIPLTSLTCITVLCYNNCNVKSNWLKPTRNWLSQDHFQSEITNFLVVLINVFFQSNRVCYAQVQLR